MRAGLIILVAGFSLQSTIASAAEIYLFDLLRRSQYRRSYNAMLSLAPEAPKWIAYYSKTLNGPSQPAQDIKADGETYLLADVCKVHDCLDYKLQVVFAVDGRQAWGRIYENGSTTWIGHPSPALRKAVDKIDF